MATTGTLNIHTENIFPIIKQFLYQDQEVFLRELVSNAVDATQKLHTLARAGEVSGELGDTHIEILLDEAAGTLTVRDRGLGMTAAEVEKYINQIAFSSAEEFLERYKDKGGQVIGHFGLGFYSAFMVAGKVELLTQSYQAAPAAHWVCEGTTTFSLDETSKDFRGTDVVLHVLPEHAEYLKAHRIREILTRHCRFLPIPIHFEGEQINTTAPAWTKKPAELTDADYLAFYKELYPFQPDPLFWIHLNVDYPFTLTGILYFPRVKEGVDFEPGKIQLYANQVFITDEVDQVVPDFLMLLHGVIDSPDIPLNVSRSALQADGNVRKISGHIAKKVADKLQGLFADDRAAYEAKWPAIGLFVKYGMLRDTTFYERVQGACLLQSVNGTYRTLDEYTAFASANQTNKDGGRVILYTHDPQAHHSYVAAAEKKGYDVVVLGSPIDPHWLPFIEHKLERTHFYRVDSDSLDKLIDKGLERVSQLTSAEEAELKALLEPLITSAPGSKLELHPLGEDELPITVAVPEFQRRMKDMARSGMFGLEGLGEARTVTLNTAHPFGRRVLLQPEGERRTELLQQAYDLALLQQDLLKGPALTAFLQRSIAALS